VLWPFLDPDVVLLAEFGGVAFDETGEEDEIGFGRNLEELRDPRRGHERRDRDLHRGDVGRELRLHSLQCAPEGRFGELAVNEEAPPEPVLVSFTWGRHPVPIYWVYPRGRRRTVSRARSPRSSSLARSPCR